jgi:hypothetical protein
MSDETIASIGRQLADAMVTRARTRLPDDQKKVLDLQTQLCAAVKEEREQPKPFYGDDPDCIPGN